MTPIIEARGLRKMYGAFLVVDDVSLSVGEGELVSIVGPNGAGKTTLVNLLTGLLRPNAGEIRFKGKDIAGIGPVKLAKLGMARAFQLVNIFPGLTVRETLAVAIVSQRGQAGRLLASLDGDAETHARVRAVAEIFGLERRLDVPAGTLAQGEKKLLDVASAFALRPEAILLDEPTSGVSTADKHGIMKVLIEAARAAGVKAIVQVEHDMDLVAQYSHRIVALHEGRVLADKTPDAFFSDPALLATIVGKARR
jgi:branched-chain amino acid transport system ATP-binding protein